QPGNISVSALGHVWTQELSDVAAALVGCGHVSGLLMRRVRLLALMRYADWVPIERTHLTVRGPKRVLPIPGTIASARCRHALANGYGRYPLGRNPSSQRHGSSAVSASVFTAIWASCRADPCVVVHRGHRRSRR